VGDEVYVSGTLGDAAAALSVLRGEWRPDPQSVEFLLDRFNRPSARITLGRELLEVASAAIDISDGLLADAGHIADGSGVRICIDAQKLPLSAALAGHPSPEQGRLWALTGGDDYELCFCLPAGAVMPSGCTPIGTVAEGEGVECGMDIDIPPGYQHFSA